MASKKRDLDQMTEEELDALVAKAMAVKAAKLNPAASPVPKKIKLAPEAPKKKGACAQQPPVQC